MKKGPHQRGISSFSSRTIMALIVFLTSAIYMAGSGLASQFEIPELVAPGNYQFELGYTFLREDDTSPDTSTHSLPAPTFITGVFSNLEIELIGDGLIITNPDQGKSTEDGSDFSMFGKFGITSENGWIPNTAALPVDHHPQRVPQHRQVVQRVRRHQHEVRMLSHLDGAGPLLDAQRPGGVDGGRLQRLW